MARHGSDFIRNFKNDRPATSDYLQIDISHVGYAAFLGSPNGGLITSGIVCFPRDAVAIWEIGMSLSIGPPITFK